MLGRAGNAVAQFYMEWFRLSAEEGYVEAEAVLGYHYMQGLGVAQSYAEAYMSAINGCQAQANQVGHAVTCVVPIIDWNPKTWQDC